VAEIRVDFVRRVEEALRNHGVMLQALEARSVRVEEDIRTGLTSAMERVRESDRQGMGLTALREQCAENRRLIDAMYAVLYESNGQDSLLMRLRLQQEQQRLLEAWKSQMVTRFWQVVTALLTTVALLVGGTLWQTAARLETLQTRLSTIERSLESTAKGAGPRTP
jgi:hypothetical protein